MLSPKIAELDALIVGQSPQTCPRGPKGEKRPADVVGNAVHVMRIATGEVEDQNPGKARQGIRDEGRSEGRECPGEGLTPEQRSEITRMAAEARWTKPR